MMKTIRLVSQIHQIGYLNVGRGYSRTKEQQIAYAQQQINQAKYEIDNRVQILGVEPLLSLARQMQELKIVMNQVLPFIKTIYEKAQIENIDLNTAVYQTIQEIRLYFQMSGLQKGVQSLESRIAILNMVAMQKEQALSILYELQNRGVSIVQDFGIGSILQT